MLRTHASLLLSFSSSFPSLSLSRHGYGDREEHAPHKSRNSISPPQGNDINSISSFFACAAIVDYKIEFGNALKNQIYRFFFFFLESHFLFGFCFSDLGICDDYIRVFLCV